MRRTVGSITIYTIKLNSFGLKISHVVMTSSDIQYINKLFSYSNNFWSFHLFQNPSSSIPIRCLSERKEKTSLSHVESHHLNCSPYFGVDQEVTLKVCFIILDDATFVWYIAVFFDLFLVRFRCRISLKFNFDRSSHLFRLKTEIEYLGYKLCYY